MIDWSLSNVITEYFWDLQRIRCSFFSKDKKQKHREEAELKLKNRYENLKSFCLEKLTLHEMQMINNDVGFNLIDKADIDKKLEEK